MKKIRLIHETRVNLPSGTLCKVSDDEALRLVAFGVGEVVEEKKTPKKEKKEEKK